MWQVIRLYLRCFLHFFHRTETPETAAFRSLIQRHSYRIKAADQKNLLIGFRYLRLTLGMIWKTGAEPVLFPNSSHFAVFDGHIRSAEGRCHYLKGITGNEIRFVLAKNALSQRLTIIQKIMHSCGLLVFALFLIPVTFFHPHRGSIALNMMELLENAFSLQHAISFGIKEVYYFNGYEKDANFAALLLRNNGIRCTKIPSANPIKNFYQQTIADRFCFTAAFQQAEYRHLKNRWFVNEVAVWPLFGYDRLLPLARNTNPALPRTLGFISSGVWLRKERGDQGLGVGEMESELHLVELLQVYLTKRTEIEFVIYLHPIEKKTPETVARAQEHYRAIFGNRVRFASTELPSNQQFDLADVSIAAHSSTNLERLFLGLKTLYAPLHYARDIFEDDPISRIAAFDPESVESLIDRAMDMSNEAFFDTYGMGQYRHDFFFPQT